MSSISVIVRPQSTSNPLRYAVNAAMLASSLFLAACGGGGDGTSSSTSAGATDTTAGTSATTAATKETLSSVSSFDVASATKIADENGSFTLIAAATVYYGANGHFNAVQLAAGTYSATNALFGGDPATNSYKAAYVVGTDAIVPFDASKAIQIGAEGQTFTLTTTAVVYYGAGTSFATRQLTAGTYTAGNALFGDPAPNQWKAAYVLGTTAITAFDVSTATKIGDENSQFTLTAAGTVYFGANGHYTSKALVAGTYYANTQLFGDPASGYFKSAYVVGTASITVFDPSTATKVASENSSFTLTVDATVYFGANGSYTSRQLTAGTYQATASLLGDAAPSVLKTAYVTNSAAVVPFDPTTAVKLAAEGEPFYLSATARVFFGGNGQFTSKTLASGTYTANTALFGDPASGVAKAAYVVGTASIPVFDSGAASKIADEGGQFTLLYNSIVFFGTGSSYTSRLLAPGTYTANSSIFADPAPGSYKAAYILSTDDNGPRASAPPTITTQPQSLVVSGGQAAVFSVVAASDTVVRFQWSVGGTAITGATDSSYTLAAATLNDANSRFTVAVTNNAGTTTSATAVLTVNATQAQVASANRPFSDQSLWNSRPTQVTLGTFQVPTSFYYPTVAEGNLSVGVFSASNSDPAVSVAGPSASESLYVPDAEQYVSQITIPHWPANVVPASGDDGHADIVDVAANKIHSFYRLHKDGDQWRAAQYTWTALDGRGWGTPAQYFQGSRAAGVVPMAGMIRTFELADGLPAYKHALAMSMTYTGLSANPTYTYPATSADIYASSVNSGGIAEGALMMLPANFDLSKIKDPRLLKVVRTLQTYGAYVVDTNLGAPFIVYVELGSGFQLMPDNTWDAEIASELDLIRSSMRQAVSTSGWVDANGVPFTPNQKLNLLSLRGGWYPMQGSTVGTFDTWTQTVTFANNGQKTVQINTTGRSMPTSLWGGATAGKTYKLSVTAGGGATLQFTLMNGDGTLNHATAELANGVSHTFVWPTGSVYPQVRLTSGANGGGTVAATLIEQ